MAENTLVSWTNVRKSQIPVCQTPFWRNVFWFSISHIGSLFAIYFLLTGNFMWHTIVFGMACVFAWLQFTMLCFYLQVMGLTAGAHRLWSHRSYKAKTPLKLILLFCQTIAAQDSILIWCRDHRLHHKHSDTDADPHNINRGIIFSHIGWLFCHKNDSVMKGLHKIDISDLESDPILMFQHKHYWYTLLPSTIMISVYMPILFWGETLFASFALTAFRITLGHHCLLLINSVAHRWGYRPYEKSLGPADNVVVSALILGEGWHNFHHAFPWDYRSSEVGVHKFNFPTAFINFFARIGWAYDLKSVSKSHIEKRARRTGDGSWTPQGKGHEGHHVHGKSGPWGWGDKNNSENDKDCTQILYSKSKPTCLQG